MQTFDGVWSKRHFLAIWIVQLICSGITGLYSVLLLVASNYLDDNYEGTTVYGFSTSYIAKIGYIIGSILMIISAFTIISVITEITLYSRRKLNPVTVLVLSCIKTLVWGGFAVYGIVASVVSGDPSVLWIVLGMFLGVTSVIQLCIGATFTHRKRRGLLSRGNYEQTYNPHASNAMSDMAPMYKPRDTGACDTTYHPPSELPSPHPYGHEQDGPIRYNV